MPVCEICGEDVSEVKECKMCGVIFCQDCGDFERELCEDCIFEMENGEDEEDFDMDDEENFFDEDEEDFFEDEDEEW